ncbi:hypothetical protein CHUAL_000692 [Chamberlinius hualienensis]
MLNELMGDEAVQATNDDAAVGKRCAVQLGYFSDPYLQHFCRLVERKPPEMNRGNYIRTQSVTQLVTKFIKMTNGHCQIVNFGAGFDTLYWRLCEAGFSVKHYTEIDFATVTAKKTYLIKKSKLLWKQIEVKVCGDEDVRCTGSEIFSPTYNLLSADLRNIGELAEKLKEAKLDPNIPTLFISECVLVYLETFHSETLIQWIAEHFPTAVFICYEQVNMTDRFGNVMIENLKQRGCHLAGVSACDNLSSQEQRFLSTGWSTAHSVSMMQIYSSLPPQEIQRVERLEFLDEKELMEQLFNHYSMTVATKDSHQLGLARLEV